MTKRFFYRVAFAFSIIYLIGSTFSAKAQNTDSLSLESFINNVVQNHPAVLQAREALNSADARIGLAKSGYYPDVDISASYTRIGPVPELTFPGLGNFELYPANNYNAALNLRQNIYDFGKTSNRVDLENETKKLAGQVMEQVKQRLALSAVNVFYNIAYLQEAIKIKKEQINTLRQHLDFVQKRLATGSGTQYEVLSTNVRIAGVESQRIDLLAALRTQLANLNSLRGQPVTTPQAVRLELNVTVPSMNEEAYLNYAQNHRYEISLAKERQSVAELNYKVVSTQDNPGLNVFGSAGFKNGYIPDLNIIKANYVAGIGFSYPLFDAERSKNNILIARSAIETNKIAVDSTSRIIANEVIENSSNMEAARQKVQQFELQFNQASQALALAQTSFQSGVITNLDLLDAATAVSESRLMLLKARIDYTVSAFRLKAALGERLY